MTIREREEELFQRWRTERGYGRFIKDGVFDEGTWRRQTVRLTFILKEANWPGGDGDLRWNLVHEPDPRNWRTWNNVARWTKALLEGGAYPGRVSAEERVEWLKRVSFLNLKKVGGGPVNDVKALWSFAHNDAELIREQLSLYGPDIIVCCGRNTTAKFFREEILQREDLPGGARPVLDRGSWFYTRLSERERLTAVVPFVHPQTRRSGHALWKELYEQLLEIRAALPPPSEGERRPQGPEIPCSPKEIQGTDQVGGEDQQAGVGRRR